MATKEEDVRDDPPMARTAPRAGGIDTAVQKETTYRLARERIEYYRYGLFKVYSAVYYTIIVLMLAFMFHPHFSLVDSLGLPFVAATSTLVVWIFNNTVHPLHMRIGRWTVAVHGLFMFIYVVFLFLYGWIYGGADAIHDRGSLILWVASIIGVIVILVINWILVFANLPNLYEEQNIVSAYAVEREQATREGALRPYGYGSRAGYRRRRGLFSWM